ncbi:MAG: hypothetical protein R6X14_01140 [bacterium]
MGRLPGCPGYRRFDRLLAIFLLFATGCHHAVNVGPPPDPQSAPGEVDARLGRLESFAFRLEYRTDRPFELGASFTGVRDSLDRESWRGTWWRGSERSEFVVVGDGAVQYTQSAEGWEREPRGNESRIFDHLEQVLRTRPEFVGEAGASYRYEFEPKLPVLDPSGSKQLRGEMELDRRTGLPRQVRCHEPDGPARWTLSLSRFNRAGWVRVPFLPVQELLLAPARQQTRQELGNSVRVVRERLEASERRYRLFRRRGQLVLQLEREETAAVLDLLLGPGRVEFRVAEEVPVLDTVSAVDASILEVGGDASRRVRLFERLGGNGDFDVGTTLEFVARPLLTVAGRKQDGATRLPDSGAVALVLDGRVVDVARVSGGRLEFADAGSRERVPVLVVIAGLPATAGLLAESLRRLP